MMPAIRLGVPQSGYNVDRNITGSLPAGFRRIRPVDRARLATAVGYRLLHRLQPYDQFRFVRPYWPRVELFHFFNSVADVRVPWVCTFENELPRWEGVSDSVYRRGVSWMINAHCKRLLAFSRATLHVAQRRWEHRLPKDLVSALMAKAEVLLPPQEIFVSDTNRPAHPVPTFAFVGRDFYRKGGLHMLEAFAQLWERGQRQWKAIVIGSLDAWGDYASQTTATDRERAIVILRMLSDNVIHQPAVPAKMVGEILRSADYYVLPTLADTFGYSVLEAQACGAMSITTNVRSLTEIVDDATGMIIELPLDEYGDAHRITPAAALRHTLVSSLAEAIAASCDLSATARQRKVEAALDNLRTRHSPSRHRARLREIYLQALGR